MVNKFDFNVEIEKFMLAIENMRISQKESDERFEKEREEDRKSFKKLEEAIAKTEEAIAKTDEIMKKNDEIMKKNEEKLTRMGITFGNFQNNSGEEKEIMFYEYLKKYKELNNIKFDEVLKNLSDGKREYDIVMKNGKYVAMIEVKQKAHENDIYKIIKEQVPDFKKVFSENKKIIVGIASPIITPTVKEIAKQNGIILLSQNGENVSVEVQSELKFF